MDVLLDGSSNGFLDGCIVERTHRWMDERVDHWLRGSIVGLIGIWVDRSMVCNHMMVVG